MKISLSKDGTFKDSGRLAAEQPEQKALWLSCQLILRTRQSLAAEQPEQKALWQGET